MKIRPEYLSAISRYLSTDRTREDERSPGADRKTTIDRRELSQIAGFLQELARSEPEQEQKQAERLQALAKKIEQGSYNPDAEEIAAAMLGLPDDPESK